MKVKLPIVAVHFNDHVSSSRNEIQFQDIQKDPLKPIINTIYGVKTYEDEDFITVSSETLDYNQDKKTDFRFDRHLTIVKSCIINFEKLGQIELEIEDDESG